MDRDEVRQLVRDELQRMAEDGELERLLEVSRACAPYRAAGVTPPGSRQSRACDRALDDI
ncbi:hypothetical protein H7I53_18000 [Mycolicibacterium pulveris]|uniref:Uncharacterized protein n=1 Tax=Mycolicibacterium pulveris TaxID=36813 RepID=A0A7I7UDU2_MYCPV|nr:hypothetical protein [Mycolicibacterium pulveris]MCV6982109.1 hypothetical protein [Mycolicibacterium pulveris]BBY78849.1 hypothetical protein MPUL_00070 [Mycolicibacterium pulveris]